jgi:hypothetical protein
MARRDAEDSSKDKDTLKEHEIVSKIVKDSGYGNATLLVGYIGKTDKDNNVRLYFNLNFDEYVDVPRESILHSANAPEDVLPFGGTYLWVKKDEHITYVRVESTKQQAKFLQGTISRGLVSPPEPVPAASFEESGLLPPRSINIDGCPVRSDDLPCRTPDTPCGHPRRTPDFPCTPPRRTPDFPCTPPRRTPDFPCTPPRHSIDIPCRTPDFPCGPPSRIIEICPRSRFVEMCPVEP